MKYLQKSFSVPMTVKEGPKTADWDEVFSEFHAIRCICCGKEVDLPRCDRFKGVKWCSRHYCPDCCKYEVEFLGT